MPDSTWRKSATFWEAFWHAGEGIILILRQQRNTRIIVTCAVLAIGLGASLRLPGLDFAIIVFVAATVLAAEMGNSALEIVCDIVWPEYRESVKRAKDLAAGAVLVLSAAALMVGAALFIPPLLRIFLE